MSGFQIFSFPGRPGGVKSCPCPPPSPPQRRKLIRGPGKNAITGHQSRQLSGGLGVSLTSPRGHRAGHRRREGSASGLDRRGDLFKVLHVEGSEIDIEGDIPGIIVEGSDAAIVAVPVRQHVPPRTAKTRHLRNTYQRQGHNPAWWLPVTSCSRRISRKAWACLSRTCQNRYQSPRLQATHTIRRLPDIFRVYAHPLGIDDALQSGPVD